MTSFSRIADCRDRRYGITITASTLAVPFTCRALARVVRKSGTVRTELSSSGAKSGGIGGGGAVPPLQFKIPLGGGGGAAFLVLFLAPARPGRPTVEPPPPAKYQPRGP